MSGGDQVAADHGDAGADQNSHTSATSGWRWPFAWLFGSDEPMNEEVLAEGFSRGMVARYGEAAPQFLECSAKNALQRAKNQFELLLVYVHSELHQDTDGFVRDVLCDEEISQHIRENFLVWGADVTQPDGFECQKMFQVGGFPYVGVYLHAGANKVQCVWSHEGYMPKAELLAGLQSAVTHGKPVVLQQRVAEETRQADRRLREEQEAMYQETMMQDMQRQAAAEAEEQKEHLMDALKLSRQMAKDEEMAAARARVEACPEPAVPDGRGVGVDGQLVSSIRLQFSDGTKVQRRFPASATVQIVRDYALVLMSEVHGTSPDDVELTSSYPRRTFGAGDLGTTLQEAGWHPRVALFATGIEHSDDTELEGEAHRAVGTGGAAGDH